MDKKKKQSDIGKIYKTTDGYFTKNSKQKKPRNVAVVEQRKDDGALAVCKIYSQEGKSGKSYIGDLILKPENHPSLKENSLVGRQILIGRKDREGNYTAIFSRDFTETSDKLTKKERKHIRKNAGGETRQNKKTNKKKIKKWKKHFKK